VRQRAPFAFLLIAALLASAADTKTFAPPPAHHAKTYPAHESHDDEKVSIAIDPFDMPDKTKIFSINYQENNFLPIRLIIANDSDNYVMLNEVKVQYITLHRDKLEPATAEDIYRRFIHLKRNPGSGVPSPLPLPRKSPVTKDAKIAMNELVQAQFVPHPVDPHSIRSGFLFFDLTGIDPPEAGAHVYISGLKVGGKELFYFDIPMEKYLSYQPGK
jgi:hypothetical protein